MIHNIVMRGGIMGVGGVQGLLGRSHASVRLGGRGRP